MRIKCKINRNIEVLSNIFPFLSKLQLQLLYIVVIRATNKNMNTSYDKRAV